MSGFGGFESRYTLAMESEPRAPLLASEGATFSGLVAEVAEGWRASAVLQLKGMGKDLEEQIVVQKTFASTAVTGAVLWSLGDGQLEYSTVCSWVDRGPLDATEQLATYNACKTP